MVYYSFYVNKNLLTSLTREAYHIQQGVSFLRYNNKTHKILSLLYCLRVLSYKQIKTYIFDAENLSETYCEKNLKLLVSSSYVEKNGYYKEESYYFITKQGISFLKEFGVISVNGKESSFFPKYKTATSIKIKDVYVQHQLSLNEFVLQFRSEFPQVCFEYYDEIYTSSIIDNIRPDGVLKIGETLYFLEMDMNTERKTRLMNKWNNYRNFFTSPSYYNLGLNIRVVFILGGDVGKKSTRKYELQSYIDEYLQDVISDRFNVIIGTQGYLLSQLRDYSEPAYKVQKILQKHFRVSKGRFSDSSLMDFSFDSYAYKPDKMNQIVIEHGVPLEFVVDDYCSGCLYVYKKIKHFPKILMIYRQKKNKDLRYIVFVEDEQQALTLSKSANTFSPYILFTTRERMLKKSLYEALFYIDSEYQMFHFYENDLTIPVLEKKLRNNF